MHSHKLTETDSWFIEKGRVDSLSRSPFVLGNTVVVCNNKHVMLLEFYEGKCPTCNSEITLPFSRSNVDYLSPQKAASVSPQRLYPARTTRKFFPLANKVLGWTLGILVFVVCVLTFTGSISNESLIYRLRSSVFPKTRLMLESAEEFFFPDAAIASIEGASREILAKNGDLPAKPLFTDKLSALIIGANNYIIVRNKLLSVNIITAIIALVNGLIVIAINTSEQLQAAYHRTKELSRLFTGQTRILIDVVKKLLGGIASRSA